MKIAVKKYTNKPQLYEYTVYIPNPKVANGVFAEMCAQYIHPGNFFPPQVKRNYLYLANGLLYGGRKQVLTHIALCHLIPNGGVIRLLSNTGGERSTWIYHNEVFYRTKNFMEG